MSEKLTFRRDFLWRLVRADFPSDQLSEQDIKELVLTVLQLQDKLDSAHDHMRMMFDVQEDLKRKLAEYEKVTGEQTP